MKKMTLALMLLALMGFTGCGTDTLLGPDTAVLDAQDDDTAGEIKEDGKKKDLPQEDDSGENKRSGGDNNRDGRKDVIDGSLEIPGGAMGGDVGTEDPGHGEDVEDGN